MSDRVVTIGGAQIHRDHFPWPYIAYDVPGATGVDTVYPSVLDLFGASYWFHIVRAWHFTAGIAWRTRPTTMDPWADFTGTVSLDIEPKITGDMGLTWTAPTRETDLLYLRSGPTLSWHDIGAGYVPVFDEQVTISNYSSSGFSSDFALSVALLLDNFQPFWVTGSFTFAFRANIDIDGAVSTTIRDGTYTDGFGEIDVDGFNAGEDPWRVVIWGAPVNDSTDLFQRRSISASLKGQVFWPYKTSMGDPVYDTSTGDIINDPFS